jgi:hypothetical protein
MEPLLRPLLKIKVHFIFKLGHLPHNLKAALIIGGNLLGFKLVFSLRRENGPSPKCSFLSLTRNNGKAS